MEAVLMVPSVGLDEDLSSLLPPLSPSAYPVPDAGVGRGNAWRPLHPSQSHDPRRRAGVGGVLGSNLRLPRRLARSSDLEGCERAVQVAWWSQGWKELRGMAG